MLLVILLVATVLWMAYKYWTSVYNVWERRGVPYIPAKFPFGSDSRLTTLSHYEGYTHDEMCQKFTSDPYFGIYIVRSPVLIVKSPEVIKVILSSEFSHFRDRQFLNIHECDILAQDLFDLKGEKWRALRVKMVPTFTSGKLKEMFPLFLKCAENFEALLINKLGHSIDVKESVALFTTDVICNCAFGLDTNTIANPDNEVRKRGTQLLDTTARMYLLVFLNMAFPEFCHLIPMKFYSDSLEKFFVKLIRDSVEYREKNNIRRKDFLDLLIQMKNEGAVGKDMKEEIDEPFDMTIELMTAQCVIFFAAGFETSSSVQTFCLYELALNLDIQRRVQNEIDAMISKHGGITFDGIKEMKYLQCVLSETMRKYPTLPFLMRLCTKPLALPGGLTTVVGDRILIPLWSLQHDPQYFPDPEQFDPERFSDENIESVKPYTYMPFGEGPRICIGMRFGLLQTKVGLISILRKYNVEPTKDTKIPIVMKGDSITTCPKDPICLKFVPR